MSRYHTKSRTLVPFADIDAICSQGLRRAMRLVRMYGTCRPYGAKHRTIDNSSSLSLGFFSVFSHQCNRFRCNVIEGGSALL